MRTKKQIQTIADGIYAEAVANINKVVEVKKATVEGMASKSADEKVDIISQLVTDTEAQIKAPVVEGVSLPAYIIKTSVSDDCSAVTVAIRSKLKAVTKFSKTVVVAVDDDFVKNVGVAILNALFELFYIEMANENIAELNARIAEITSANDIPYTFSFELQPDSDAVVLAITDDNVVFNASLTEAMSISGLSIMLDGDEYNKLVRAEAEETLVKSLKSAQTTPQLIKAKVKVIETITAVTTKKRASKIIRGSYHRQAKNLVSVKTGIGYFEGEVTINGEVVDVFALVEKVEDGSLKVILKPFDVKTLLNVEYDVIGAIA